MSMLMTVEEALQVAADVLNGDFDFSRGDAPLKIAGLCRLLLTMKSVQPEATAWIPCSERLPEEWQPFNSAPMFVLGWFPGMERPSIEAANQVRWWATADDPIPGAMWMPLPQIPSLEPKKREG